MRLGLELGTWTWVQIFRDDFDTVAVIEQVGRGACMYPSVCDRRAERSSRDPRVPRHARAFLLQRKLTFPLLVSGASLWKTRHPRARAIPEHIFSP